MIRALGRVCILVGTIAWWSSSVALADMTIVEKHSVTGSMGPPERGTTTIYYKGTKTRKDSPDGTYSVLDLDTGNVNIVDPKRKQVKVITGEFLRTADLAFGQLFANELYTELKHLVPRRTGNTRSIKGYTCHEYVATAAGIHVVNWVTEEVDTKEIDAFKPFLADISSLVAALSFSTLDGMVMRSEGTITRAGQNMTFQGEVQSISRRPLPDSLFVIPPSYTVRPLLGPDPEEEEKSRKRGEAIDRRRQQFERSVTVGPATYRLSCPTAHPQLAREHATVYERITFSVPITVTSSGEYIIRMRYTSEHNQKERSPWTVHVEKEEKRDLSAGKGKHQLEFVYSFGDTGGMFVQGPASVIEISVHKYTSEHEMFGSIGREDSKRKTFYHVTTKQQRIETVANVSTSGIGRLVCR